MLRYFGLTALSWMAVAPAMAEDAVSPPPPVETVMPPARSPTPMAAPSGATPGFGAQGQIVISADLPFRNEAPELAVVHSSTSMGGSSSTEIGIEPGLDYFVAQNVSIGGEVGIDYTTLSPAGGGPSLNATTLVAEARVGYNLALGDTLSLWLRVGIGYDHVDTSSGGNSVSGYSIPLFASAPLLWHPGFHFVLGAGPMLATQLVNKIEGSSQGKITLFGVQGLIGGTFGGS
jgi:opacity protein-like surface antigen